MRRHVLLVPLTALALTVAACADAGTPADTPTDGGGAASAAVTFAATDAIAWSSTELSAAAGSVELTLVCGENVNHSIAIEGVQGDAELEACAGGETVTTTVDLEAGTYTFFCAVPGHRDVGMEGTLTVS